jgi:isoleucyl-tRNA synthetase
MEPAYQEVIAREFGRFVGTGVVYKGLKPVHWCMHCKTALAQAEVEYEDQTTQTVYVRFPVRSASPALAQALGGKPAALVIWTTTPWTLPANLAIAVNPTDTYTVVELQAQSPIVRRPRAEPLAGLPGVRGRASLTDVAIPGQALEGTVARHPWIDRDSPVLAADFVAMDTGTGLVHIAPGHGEEDYELVRTGCLKFYIPAADVGRYIPEVELFARMTVWEANPKIVEHLRKIGALVAEVTLNHEYPHCWRCKNPTLFRATEQWFISLDKKGLRQRALEAVEREVAWIPAWGRDRIFNMIAHRPDWTISRQRVWGVPIVAFYCGACETLLVEERLVEYVAAIMRDGRGAEEWHARAAKDLLPPGTRCPKCGGEEFRKETDILDVWFDSGCSHAAVLETRPELRWPAEMYLEGSDQHRGWFHSSLLEAVGTRNRAPYQSVLTHGFVVDGEGRKMSKSQGNYVQQEELIPKYGAEVLRLWVASEDYAEDIRLSHEILNRLSDAYRRIRNTFRFLLGALAGFDPDRDRVSYDQMDEIDRWSPSCVWASSSRVPAAPTRSTSSTWSSTPPTTSRWISRSISTSSRIASTPARPMTEPPRLADGVLRDAHRARPDPRAHPVLHHRRSLGYIPGAASRRACTSSPCPRSGASGSTSAWPPTGSVSSKCAARCRAPSSPRASRD